MQGLGRRCLLLPVDHQSWGLCHRHACGTCHVAPSCLISSFCRGGGGGVDSAGSGGGSPHCVGMWLHARSDKEGTERLGARRLVPGWRSGVCVPSPRVGLGSLLVSWRPTHMGGGLRSLDRQTPAKETPPTAALVPGAESPARWRLAREGGAARRVPCRAGGWGVVRGLIPTLATISNTRQGSSRPPLLAGMHARRSPGLSVCLCLPLETLVPPPLTCSLLLRPLRAGVVGGRGLHGCHAACLLRCLVRG